MENSKISILALCATHNRREVTLSALESLSCQSLPIGTTLEIAVVDDRSTDGTLEAIQAKYPEVLTTNSTGESYWAGSMRIGFSRFWEESKYSHLLVFNDDCHFVSNAIQILLKVAADSGPGIYGDMIVVGSLSDEFTNNLTYGGLRRLKWRPRVFLQRIQPTATPQIVDTLNMNIALISAKTLALNNFIDQHFIHSGADYDFGLRATRNGTTIFLAPGFLGKCSRNVDVDTWRDHTLPFHVRWSMVQQPKGLPFGQQYHYLSTHAPFAWPVIWVWPYLNLCLSHLVVRTIAIIRSLLRC